MFSTSKNSISTGSMGLDYFLGGGFLTNSINLIEEDEFSVLSNLLVYSFISNQVSNNENVLVSLPKKSNDFLKLPKKKNIKFNDKILSSMRIAWRYNNLPNLDEKSMNHNFQFDFSSKLTKNELDNLDYCTHDELLNCLSKQVLETEKQHLTIVILNYFSFLNPIDEKNFSLFLYKLKSISRTQNITIVLTANTEFILSQTFNHSLSISDCVLSVEKIDQEESIYKDYNGIIKIKKLPKINFLNYTTLSETMDIGIKLIEHHKYLIVDRLCLPPELSETANRSTCSTKINF